jgi:hypothetical protein
MKKMIVILNPEWDSKKRHLPPKSKLCSFGNVKNKGLTLRFGLFNHVFPMELKTPFPKGTFCQKSQFTTVLPNRP